jgi:hypothetical protein
METFLKEGADLTPYRFFFFGGSGSRPETLGHRVPRSLVR